jgi:type III restriction enzyme
MSKVYRNRYQWYRVIVKDLLKAQHSVLAKVIELALQAYRPIYTAEVGERAKGKKQTVIIDVPPADMSFTELFEKKDVKVSAMEPFYIEKEYAGKKNETAFIDYLEEHPKVEWWYKNGDSGNEFFALPYFDAALSRERLFYPDWFVKAGGKLWVLDTKGGWTADSASASASDKNAGLSQWLADDSAFDGGIVVCENGIWKITRKHDGRDVKETLVF